MKGSDLHRAVINADMEEIASLLKRGVPMEVQNSRGLTPLQVFEILYQIRNWNFLVNSMQNSLGLIYGKIS